jgi:drug/metabolite transporter (DMT)-like permease
MHLVILLYALFASVFTTAKTALIYTQPYFLIGSRMFCAGCLLLAYQYLFRRKTWDIQKSDWTKFALLGFLSIYLTNVLEFIGLKHLTSFKTCFIYSLSPFLSALLAHWILKEKMTSKKWLGLAVGFAGFIPILLNQSDSEAEMGQLWLFSWAELAVVGAAVTSVYGWILLKQMVAHRGYSPISTNGMSMILGGGMALAHSACSEDWNPIPVTEFWPFLLCAFTLMIISNGICYNLYGYLLKRYSATFMSFAGFTTPVFTALFGWILLGEVVTWPFYLSFAIVLAGLLLFYQEELQSRKVAAS